MKFALNTLLSAILVAGFAALGKRSTLAASILIALPLTSILALSFLHVETGEPERVAKLSLSIFWLVLPTLLFFPALAGLLRLGLGYWPSLLACCAGLAGIFLGYSWLLGKFGVEI